MQDDALLALASAILAQPTAPFHEEAVRAEIERQLSALPHVSYGRDEFGNVIALYQRGPAAPRYAFAAHMDHPAYVGGDFMGGVPKSYLEQQPPTRDFGAFAMWDLEPFAVREGCLYSRACDDLIGCIAIVRMFQELEAKGVETACYGLFTRAEEVGFVGAIHLAQSRRLPAHVVIVSLETSSERGGPVRMHEGVIIRVGDRTSVFDSNATAQLVQIARGMALPHQRTLMSGGTCEATAYQLYGYRATGVCVALGNYHNCSPDGQIAAEYVSLADVQGLVRLCVAAASAGEMPDPATVLRQQLEAGMREYERYF